MLSAKGRDVEVNKGVSLGADLYITKPFSTQSLLEAIDRFFDGRRDAGRRVRRGAAWQLHCANSDRCKDCAASST